MEKYSQWVQVFYDFQTFIAGILALIAAGIGACFVMRAARLQIKAQKEIQATNDHRIEVYLSRLLADEITRLERFCIKARATIVNQIHSGVPAGQEIKSSVMLEPNPIIQNIDAVSHIPAHLINPVIKLYSELNQHNYDVSSVSSFGSPPFQQQILNRLTRMHHSASVTAKRLSKYAELKASETAQSATGDAKTKQKSR